MTNSALLDIKDLTVHYGGIQAVKGISLTVGRGEIVTLIGANGAGKTSTLKAISGMLAYQGKIIFDGSDMRGSPAHEIVGRGIAHVPEGRQIFGNLTVMENLRLATWQVRGKPDYDYVFNLFPRMAERRKQLGGTLSGGEQQMLAIARGLMSKPALFLLDEPSMGLSPVMEAEIFNLILNLNKEGKTILLVEQNAAMALKLAARAYVLAAGQLVLEGSGKDLQNNPRIREAYLGI